VSTIYRASLSYDPLEDHTSKVTLPSERNSSLVS